MPFDPLYTNPGIALSNSNRTLLFGEATATGVKGSRSDLAGTAKVYAEIKIVADIATNYLGIGLTSANWQTQEDIWANSWFYSQYLGNLYIGDIDQGAWGNPYVVDDVVGIAYDPVAGKAWFSVNNVWQASGNPAAGTNPAFTGLASGLYLFAGLYTGNQSVTGNFTSASFQYSPPSGFEAWDVIANITLALQSSAHTHSVVALTLTQAHILALQMVEHTQSAAALSLTQAHLLAVQYADHLQGVEAVLLDASDALTLSACAHAQSVSAIDLTQVHSLALQSVSHALAFDAVELSLQTYLIVSPALHLMLAQQAQFQAALPLETLLMVRLDDALLIVTGDDRWLAVLEVK